MAPGSTPRSIGIIGLHKRFDHVPVLADVTLDVSPGESLALLGPSGCGKTTLLRTIAGLERPDSGRISIDNVTVSGPDGWVAPERRSVGMVFQEWALFPHLTVAKNVAYGLARQDRSGSAVEEVLDMVGLAGHGDRMPATLSGGQQQRVALARALAPRPGVLLLDEPFSNLDTALRVEIRSEVHRLLLELGITSVFVTHDQEEAFVLGDRVAVMHAGRIEQVSTPAELYTNPATRWVATFVGGATFLPAQATGRSASSIIGDIPLTEDWAGSIEVLLRPEQLRLGAGGSGRVVLVEYYGHDAMVFVDVGGTTFQVRTEPTVAVGRGDAVTVTHAGEPALAFHGPA